MQIKKMMKILNKEIQSLENAVPLKYLSNFWRSLDIPLISFEVSLILTWSENCVLTDIAAQTARVPQEDNPAIPAMRNACSNKCNI